MRLFYFLLLIISNTVAAQIEVKINSISSFDSTPNLRTFTINYQIENLSNKEICFFLEPTSLIPSSSASMSRNIIYKIFQNEEFLDFDAIFVNRLLIDLEKAMLEAKTEEEKNKIFKLFLKEKMNSDLEEMLKKNQNELEEENKKNLLNSIMKLLPYQKITFSKNLHWDKKRYFKIDDLEYYLDENIPHYIELTLNLMKEEFKKYLDVEEFEKIKNNPYFITGWFTSNKMEINFGE